MAKPPLITIGLTTYDRLDMLKEAVDSILNQDFQDFRVLIGNDCQAVPVSFENLGVKPDPRIEIINHIENLGEVKNQNSLLNMTESEWFIWLADDDVFHPTFFSKILDIISDNSSLSISAVFTNYASGASISESFNDPIAAKEASCYSANDFIKSYANRHIKLVGCYGLMKTRVLKKMSGMPALGEAFAPYSDTLLPILLAEYGSIIWLDSPLVFLRTHAASNSILTPDFEGYTIAEVKFIHHLERICSSSQGTLKTGDCIVPMIRWFANNEFTLLTRNPSLSSTDAVLQFLNYQISINFSLLEKRHWFGFCMFIVRKILRFILSKLKNKLIRSR